MNEVTATLLCQGAVPVASQGMRVREELVEHRRTSKKTNGMGEELARNGTWLCGDLSAKK
jgi:hypothetical protein